MVGINLRKLTSDRNNRREGIEVRYMETVIPRWRENLKCMNEKRCKEKGIKSIRYDYAKYTIARAMLRTRVRFFARKRGFCDRGNALSSRWFFPTRSTFWSSFTPR